MSKLVSVLMSTYKEPIDWVEKAVGSILQQTYQNLECVFIIDAPENVQMISYLKKVESNDSRVHVIINEQNMGLVNSLNNGLKKCTGDYVARMDADDISKRNRIESELKFLIENNLDIVGSNTQVFYEEQYHEVRPIYSSDWACKKVLRYYSCCPHPTWLVKKSVYDDLDGYRDVKSCEDYDFLLRAALKGYKMGNFPNVLLYYRDNPSSISHLNNLQQKSLAHYLAKRYRKKTFVAQEEIYQFITDNNFDKDAINNKAYVLTDAINGKKIAMIKIIEKIRNWVRQ